MSFKDRLQHAWNAFKNGSEVQREFANIGYGDSFRPDRPRASRGSERSMVVTVLNKVAIDAAAINVKHIVLDDTGRYLKDYTKSGLYNCLTLEANIDQTGRQLLKDAVYSMLEEGCIAIVPVDTDINPDTGSYDIKTMRVGQILQWYPEYVRVRLYNDRTGQKEDITVHKRSCAIVENPLYAIMNMPNSTLQRLIRTLSRLDIADEQSTSGKLDLIIQLPYAVKNEMRREQADRRRKDIEEQLASSKYGVAYADATEHITQLNRAVENNLMSRVEYLTNLLYSQLGITLEILNGTASEEAMNNYFSRTVEPILTAITEEMTRKFLTKTARTQGQSIKFFRDPFKLIPVGNLADIVDKFTRNEILTSNEVRQIIGMAPSSDPSADELRNKNIAKPADEQDQGPLPEEDPELQEEIQNE